MVKLRPDAAISGSGQISFIARAAVKFFSRLRRALPLGDTNDKTPHTQPCRVRVTLCSLTQTACTWRHASPSPSAHTHGGASAPHPSRRVGQSSQRLASWWHRARRRNGIVKRDTHTRHTARRGVGRDRICRARSAQRKLRPILPARRSKWSYELRKWSNVAVKLWRSNVVKFCP